MKVRYTRRARADLEAIFRYIDERNPTAAWNVKAEIVRTCNNLADLPYFGHMTDRRPDLFVVIVAAYPTSRTSYRSSTSGTRGGSRSHSAKRQGRGAVKAATLKGSGRLGTAPRAARRVMSPKSVRLPARGTGKPSQAGTGSGSRAHTIGRRP